WRQRAWYYTHIYADTKAKDTVYVLNVGFGKSTDGGKTFTGVSVPHSDNHDLWIAPDDPNRMINANDGGGNVSLDGGKTWTEQTFPTAQFYHVSTDNSFPYRILGAQQDNSTVRIVSRTQGGGIAATDWTSTAGGESGYVAAKPNDPDIVFGGSYGGDLSMLNHRTGEFRSVDPWPNNPMGHGAEDLEHRFQWTYPIVFSPHDPNLLYTCSQFVLKTTNNGQTWRKISPDLTRNDKSTMGSSGGPLTKDNTSVEYYGTVFTIAESPRRRGVIWAGSDDGLIHITQNGGESWANVTPPDMPKWGLVSMIEASPFDPGTAYAAVDNHENDDYAPYAYITTDFGKSWRKIVNGIPSTTFLRVVREDRKQRGLLYAGTETGAYVSFNSGVNWQPLQMNLPLSPIHDLAWKDDDLIAATHGRSFWVLDDLTPLQQLAKSSTKETRFFEPKDAYRIRWGGGFGRRGSGTAASVGDNPMSGLVLSYYLAQDAKDVKFEVQDSSGKVFQTLASAPKVKGFQRTSAFLQYPSYKTFPGMIVWSGGPSPILAPPGEYTVTMVADGVRKSAKFKWLRDPRNSSTDADLVEQFKFLQTVSARLTTANESVTRIRTLRSNLDKALEEAKKKGDLGSLDGMSATFRAGITKVEEAIYQTKNKSGQDPLNYPIRLNDKLAGVFSNASSGNFRPTDQAHEVFELLSGQLEVQLKELAKLEAVELKAINSELAKRGVKEVSAT
ncbi:MAG: glycosyl hydrolase, partial [Chlorobia bacterium]|nr:glycosyl hydrolase [Fimbriimonadaceae bacterium]